MNCLICCEWLKKPLPCDEFGICLYGDGVETENASSSMFDFDHD